MPKLPMSDSKIAEKIAQNCIDHAVNRKELSENELSTVIGISKRSYYRRKNDAGTYTLKELQRLNTKLKFSPTEAASLILGKEVTIKDFLKEWGLDNVHFSVLGGNGNTVGD